MAIVSQGLLIAGLVYAGLVGLGPVPLSRPQGTALVPLVAALVVAAGAWRWFHGSRWLMVLADGVLLAIGLLGTALVSRTGGLISPESDNVPIAAFVIIEVGAAFVGLIAATRQFGGGTPAPTGSADASAVEEPDVSKRPV
jgi:hypothetical protein